MSFARLGALLAILSALALLTADITLARVGGGGSFTNLVKNFQEHGLGDVVNSWISTGENLPITPEQLEQGLGTDRVQQLAEQSGLPQWSVLPMLAQLLPNVIDKLTPQGMCPGGRPTKLTEMHPGGGLPTSSDSPVGEGESTNSCSATQSTFRWRTTSKVRSVMVLPSVPLWPCTL